MSAAAGRAILVAMPRFVLDHRHTAAECPAVFAAFNGFESPLSHRPAVGSCHFGGHRILWDVDAATEEDALATLPWYVARRTTVLRVRLVDIP